MKPLADCRLYVILDAGYLAPIAMPEMARAVIRGGADILQLRAKNWPRERVRELAHLLVETTQPAGVPLIINDHPSIAADVGAAGAHIGQDDGTVQAARGALRQGQWIGKSTHSEAQIRATLAETPDYIAVGPVHPTPTKPDYKAVGLNLIRHAAAAVKSAPFFCIGGIKLENVDEVLESGATRIVVVSGILQAPDPEGYTAQLKSKLEGVQAKGRP
ncbi:MAG: thiamine phosphate synthase [Verrucomicrobiae bacterium]|nr:thiamine phosphate synthase [Verrucomicrobiae bacterium]